MDTNRRRVNVSTKHFFLSSPHANESLCTLAREQPNFSDSYFVEWTYAKAIIVCKQLARVLADRVGQGQFGVNEALGVARQMLFDAPRSLLGMKPREI